MVASKWLKYTFSAKSIWNAMQTYMVGVRNVTVRFDGHPTFNCMHAPRPAFVLSVDGEAKTRSGISVIASRGLDHSIKLMIRIKKAYKNVKCGMEEMFFRADKKNNRNAPK